MMFHTKNVFFKKNVHITYEIINCDRTDVSEGIDINKTSTSRECIICY